MPRPKGTAPRRLMQREERKEQILGAALKVFSKTGYHGTHVSHIVEAAGVARGTFYLHFESKHDVFEALIERTLGILLSVRPEGEEPPVKRRADAEAILRASYTVVFETIHKHRQLMRLLFEEAIGLDKGFRTKLERHFTTWHGRIQETLAFFQERGAARDDVDAEITAQILVGGVERLAKRHLFGSRSPDIPRLVDALVSLEMRGIAGR